MISPFLPRITPVNITIVLTCVLAMRLANQPRLSTLIHLRLSAPVPAHLEKRDNSMSLAHQTRGISRDHSHRTIQIRVFRTIVDRPSSRGFLRLLRGVLIREEHEARVSFFLFEISHWDHFHPHRTLPVPPWAVSSLEILEFWEAFKRSFGILDRLLIILSSRTTTDPPDQPPSIFVLAAKFHDALFDGLNFLTGDYHKLGLECLLRRDVKGESFSRGVERWQFCSNGTA